MTGKEKFYLLSETVGWNCSIYIDDFLLELLNSQDYKSLTTNVSSAAEHLSYDAHNVVYNFNNLNLEPKTFTDYVILKNQISYLSLVSNEEFYLNPFLVENDYHGNVNSIGDLIVEHNSKLYTINSLIISDEYDEEKKKEIIEERLEYYLNDIDSLLNRTIFILKNESINNTSKATTHFSRFLEILLFVILNLFALFIFTRHSDLFFSYIYNPDFSNSITYIIYFFIPILFMYDLFFILFHSYRAKITEPYNYAMRFIKNNASRVFEDLKNNCESLYFYISKAIDEKRILKDDIHTFSKIENTYIDIKSILESKKLTQKRLYVFLKAMLIIFFTLATILFIYSFIIYVITELLGVIL